MSKLTFKMLREKTNKKAVSVKDPLEKKLSDVPSSEDKLDDPSDENNRNADGSADSMETKSFKPIYKKTKDGLYTLNTEEVSKKKDVNENVIDDLTKIVSASQGGRVKFLDGSTATVDLVSAEAILKTHGALNINNQKKMAQKLASSKSDFTKMQKFALSQAKLVGLQKALVGL